VRLKEIMRGLMFTRHHHRPAQRTVMKLIVSGKMCPLADIAQLNAFCLLTTKQSPPYFLTRFRSTAFRQQSP